MLTSFQILQKWDEVSKNFIFYNIQEISKNLSNKNDIVLIDVGANSGTFFDELNRNLNVKRAILFEPQPKLYQYLVDKYKNDERVIVENIALSDDVRGYTLCDEAFYINLKNHEDRLNFNLGLSSIDYCSKSELKTNSFDNLRHRYNLDKIDIIKIDTETEDLLVLKGFTETVKELKNKPLIEIENNWWIKYTFEESKKLLDDFCSYNNYLNNVDVNTRNDFSLKPNNS